MALNPIKADVEYLWEVAGRTEQYAQLVLSQLPAPPAGALRDRAAAAAKACTAVRAALQVALNKFSGPYPPTSPVDFWLVVTASTSARDQLVVIQSTLAQVDRDWSKQSGRALVVFPRAEQERAGMLQQVGTAAKWVAVAGGALALAMVVWAVVRR